MSLFNDPIKWAESAAKSKVRLMLSIALHFVLVLGGLWVLYDSIPLKPQLNGLSYIEFISSSSPIFFMGALLPSMYLYSMYRMTKTIKEKSGVDTKIT
ncbi:hypothetical protein GCM10009092_13550 [Bowmanella denitrificans]|uniref:Uncharacterized protein n=1 Tax=Bowmanella denitrificans TaxID=366582 RepID=A0ABP3GR99_9ALTE